MSETTPCPPGQPAGLSSLLITLRELAQLLRISTATAERMKAGGRLPRHVTLGPGTHRWRREEIQRWIEAGCPDRKTWEARQASRPRT